MAKGARSKARKRNNAAKRVRLQPHEDARLQRIVAQMEAATGVGPTSLGALLVTTNYGRVRWRPLSAPLGPAPGHVLATSALDSPAAAILSAVAAVTLEPLAAPKKSAASARIKVTDSAMDVDAPMTTVSEGRVAKPSKAQQRRERSRSVSRKLRK